MGYKKQTLSSKTYNKSNKSNLQNYYSELYEASSKQLLADGQQQEDIDRTLLSIFSRTKIPTKTSQNRLVKLLDIDKIISINESSLKENSEQIKHMRMVASIKHSTQPQPQNTSTNNTEGSRNFGDLVRLARMHMLQQMNIPRGDQSEQQSNQINPRLERLTEIRLERLRNTRTDNRNDNNNNI